jgi:hypothetical protein
MESRVSRERRLEAFRRLVAGGGEAEAILRQVDTGTREAGATPALVAGLRRSFDAELVAAAIDLVTARRKAAGKFPGISGLAADPQAVEQASSAAVAAWKARRFAGFPVADLCCGMGGDARALAAVARERLVVVDRDPVRAWMAAVNARAVAPGLAIEEAVDDVEAWACGRDLSDWLVHLDPARRDERGLRRFDPEAGDPPLSAALAIARSAHGGAIKLSPGIPMPLPGVGAGEELEFLSEAGTLVQAVVWCGSLARSSGERRATLVEGERVHSVAGRPSHPLGPPVGAEVETLLVPDPSIERAGLLGLAEVPELAPGLGILGGRGSAPGNSDARALPEDVVPFFRRYEVLARPRPREDEVRETLRRLGAAGARVRTRGDSADADRWTRAVRTGLSPGTDLELFLLRLGDRRVALVARELR